MTARLAPGWLRVRGVRLVRGQTKDGAARAGV